jgi:ketosteroid isomerase-like protein
MTPREVVLAFWDTLNTNDFAKASKWLSPDFECHWPQSSEIILGRENFIAINSNYPANGKWQFTINSIVSEADNVVTDVSVTDGTQRARAITFHTVENGFIIKQTEFWPDPYEAPAWRAKWVKRLPSQL